MLYVHYLAGERDLTTARFELLQRAVQHIEFIPDHEEKPKLHLDFHRPTYEWWTELRPDEMIEEALRWADLTTSFSP